MSFNELLQLEKSIENLGLRFKQETLLVESIFMKNPRFPHCFQDHYKYAYRIVYTSFANDQAIALTEIFVPGHFTLSQQMLNQPFNIQSFISLNHLPIKDVIFGLHPKILSNIEALTLGSKDNNFTS